MSEERKTTPELFNELTDRLIIPLEDNEIACPTCKGLRLIYKQKNNKEGDIISCPDCYTGKLYVCKYCGKANKTDHCDCKKAQEERDNEFRIKEANKELELFKKAKKINFNDYNGYFILEEDCPVRDSDDVCDWLYDRIKFNEDVPEYLWATQSEPVFTMDLEDILYDKCEEGYEDMESHLDTNDDDFIAAQEHLDKWYKKQGDSVNIYYEDHNVVVLLNDVIKEVRERIEKGDL